MRYAAAALCLLFSSLALVAQSVIVPLASAERHPVSPLFLTGEDSGFYAFDYQAMVRLDRDGAPLDIDPIKVFGGGVGVRSVAAGAGVIAISVQDNSDDRTLVGLDRDGFALWKRPHVPAGTILFDGSAFVLLSAIWGGGITLTRFDPAGNQLAVVAVPGSKYPWRPAMARAGDDIVVTWHGGHGELIARFVDADGGMSEPRILATEPTDDMAIAASGTDVVITWSNGEKVRAVRFDRERLLGGPATLAYEWTVGSPLIAWDGRVYRVAWRTKTPGRVNAVDLRGGGLDFDAVAHFDFPVHGHAADPLLLAVAGDRFLLTSGGRSVVRGAGEPIRGDLTPHPVFTGPTHDDRPIVAWTGDRYVVAWFRITPQYEYEVHARFFSVDGAPLGPSFLVTDDAGRGSLAIAATRDTVLVAWEGDGLQSPAMRRFDVDGHMIDAAPILLTRASELDVATDGAEFMLASTYECDVFVRRVAARDPFTDSNVAPVARCAEGPGGTAGATLPKLAWDGEEYGLLYYSDNTSERSPLVIIYTLTPALVRVSRNGSATAPVSLGEYDEGISPATLAAAAGHYFTTANYTGPRLVPFDLSTVRKVDDDADHPLRGADDVVWTGQAYLVLKRNELRSYTPSGHLATSQRLPWAFSLRAAGNGCGGVMIAYVGGKEAVPRLEGVFLPCDPGRRRSVR